MIHCRPLNIVIDHDWSQTLAMATKLLALQTRANSSYEYGSSIHYDLKSLGQISDHTTSSSWHRLASPAVNKTMPWLKGFLDDMSVLNPDDSSVGRMIGDGAAHKDFPHMQTALNFIIKNTDTSAYTWVEDGEVRETYPSIEGTCWLLNTQKLHGIINNGERWALSIHFNADYDVVSKWFDEHPNIVLGNK